MVLRGVIVLHSVLIRLLLLLLLCQQKAATAQWHGRGSAGLPPVIGGQDELVEGCFNRFDVGATFVLGRENINNLRCQRRCTEAGYALSATTDEICLCGNDYPTEQHRVQTNGCNHPCSPDHASCYLSTCCGNANGTLYTVSWSGEIDPVKQTLRKLAHNYRASVSFRRKIEDGGFCDRVPLRLLAPNSDASAPPLFLSIGDGCPPGWTQVQGCDACFKQHWAQPSTRAEAEAACKTEGGELVTEELQAGAGARSGIDTYLQQQRRDGCLGQDWAIDDVETAATSSAPGPWSHFMGATHKANPSCFVCKQPRAATYPALRPHADECWFVDVVNDTTRGTSDPPPYPWCNDCSEAYLQSDRNGQFLCADAQNWLYLSWARDPAWCLWTLLVHPETGALVLLTRHNAALFYDAAAGVLACRNLPLELAIPPPSSSPTAAGDWERAVRGLENIACLATPGALPRQLAHQHLRISIHSVSRRAPELGRRECCIAAYDTSPSTPSYRCRYLSEGEGGGGSADDLVRFVQVALLVFDESRFVTAREPLPNGRVQCHNRTPELISCVSAYGQALVLIRRFRVNFGVFILDTNAWIRDLEAELGLTIRYQGLAGAGGGGGGDGGDGGGAGGRTNQLRFFTRARKHVQNDLTVLFSQFYQIIFAQVYIETRNRQLGMNVFPFTALTIQFWLTTFYLRYRWRAAFAARGGFRVSLFGRAIGDGLHSLGDLVEESERTFYMFGTLEDPVQAGVTVTDVEQGEMSWWGFDVPTAGQGEEVGNQLGGRHREFLPARNPGFG